MDAGREEEVLGRRRLGEDLVPAPEAREGEAPGDRDPLDVGHLAQHLGMRLADLLEPPGGADGLRAPPLHARRAPEEVDVVRVVHHWIEAGRPRALEVPLVDGDRAHVRVDGLRVVPGPHVDVRRHVDEVAGARDEVVQPARRSEPALRMRRRLDGVDVVMIRARVLRVAGEDGFERRDDLLGARLRPAVGGP